MGDCLRRALLGTAPVLRQYRLVYAALFAFWILAGIVAGLRGFALPTLMVGKNLFSMFGSVEGAVLAVLFVAALLLPWFFYFPSIVRTARPDFRLTAGICLILWGIVFVQLLSTGLGTMLLIIPGIVVYVGWWLAPWCYATEPKRNPFGESWDLTLGEFWSTLGYAVLLLIVGVGSREVLRIVAEETAGAPMAAIILVPVFFAVSLLTHVFVAMAHLQWFLYLRELRERLRPILSRMNAMPWTELGEV